MVRARALPAFAILTAAWGCPAVGTAGQEGLPAELPVPSIDPCQERVAEGVRSARDGDLEGAERHLTFVRARCPGLAAATQELAGLRFRQGRYSEASALAGELLRRRPEDPYAWDLLASSRFLLGDEAGALRAWNTLGRPTVRGVRVAGARRTPSGTVEKAVAIRDSEMVKPGALSRARRRAAALPTVQRARVEYRPAPGGTAALDVSLLERPLLPTSRYALVGHGLRAFGTERIRVDAAGPAGAGEVWSLDLGWQGRQRKALLGVAVPSPLRAGVWEARGGYEAGRYRIGGPQRPEEVAGAAAGAELAASAREARRSFALGASDWLSGSLAWTAGLSLEHRDDRGRFGGLEVGLELRPPAERAAARLGTGQWWAMDGARGFQAIRLEGRLRSAPGAARFEWEVASTIARTGRGSPLDLWPGAGADPAADVPLRARPLLDRDGFVQGPYFGPGLLHATVELRRWLYEVGPVRMGVAGFLDGARVRQAASGSGTASAVDAGAGIRLDVPGVSGSFRADLARGVTDGARAASFGWTPAWPDWW